MAHEAPLRPHRHAVPGERVEVVLLAARHRGWQPPRLQLQWRPLDYGQRIQRRHVPSLVHRARPRQA
jgi:hypothetical protein